MMEKELLSKSIQEPKAVPLNQWAHIAGVWNSNGMYLYVNGQLVKSKNGSYTAGITNGGLNIGSQLHNNPGAYPLEGKIDQVRIWNTGLSQTDIQSRMYNIVDSSDSKWNNLVSFWKFDEGSGQIVYDSKGNNHGQLGNSGNTDSYDPKWSVIASPVGGVTWVGNTRDWKTSNNWNTGIVPTANTDVIIPVTSNHPKTDGNVVCKSMKIEPGASLEIQSGHTVSVNGDLVLKSDINGSAALVDNGNLNVTGNIKVERYLSANRYHYVSTPVKSQGADLFAGAVKFKKWNPETRSWVVVSNGKLEPGTGYATFYSSDTVKTFSDTINNQPLNKTVSASNYGWNLLGNPYPAQINAASFVQANQSVITGTLYFWSQNDDYYKSDYATWNPVSGGVSGYQGGPVPNGYIESGQGFFVQANNNGTVKFNPTMRAADNAPYFSSDVTVQRLWLNIKTENGDYNEVLFSFFDGATTEFDSLYDGLKMKGNWYLSFYSILGDNDYAIQALPPLSEIGEVILPLGVDTRITGSYTIEIKNTERFDEFTNVYLEDRETGEMINLMETSYKVDLTKGQYRDRFYIYIIPSIKMTENDEKDSLITPNTTVDINTSNENNEMISDDEIHVEVKNRSIEIISENHISETVTLNLFDMNGRLINEMSLNLATDNTFELDVPKGYYLMRLNLKNRVITKKIFVF